MCGIWGVDFRKITVSTERSAMISAILAVGNDSRGGDSYSVWTPKEILRGLGEMAPNAYKLVKEKFYFAHTRKSTKGATTIANAHAFEVGDIILSHNGIITNHEELNNKYKRQCDVDSMHLAYHLNEKRSFNDIRGYGVIEWSHKSNPNRIYLCKMGGGELSVRGIGEAPKDVKGVLWSSDEDHLLAAVTTAKLKTFEYKITTGQVYFIEDGVMYYDKDEDGKERKLELGSSNYSMMPDWRSGYGHDYHYSGWQQDKETAKLEKEEKELIEQMQEVIDLQETTEKKDENSQRKEYFQSIWDKEEELRQKMLSDSGPDTSEFTHTHSLNGGEMEEEEFIKGQGFTGWRKVRAK
jgi:hypothetical protein